jgi:tryptophanyl-tRNA synthetase
MTKRALTGIRSSGDIHIGNYLGTIKPALALQDKYECLYFVADMHSLTTNKDGNSIAKFSYDIVATWIALGLDYTKHIIFRQSDIPLVTEYSWYLSCVTGVGFLEKAHAYKDASANNTEVNHGVFAYPILMASDILLYEPDVVPVGKDQKQHVEMARNMAGSFNALFSEASIKLPEALIEEKVMTIPGLDGRKMSKSYNNYVPIFCDEKTLRKKIMSLKTDSSDVEAPKQLRGSLIGDLYELFANTNEINTLEKKLAAGGMGWGHAKEELFLVINRELSSPRQKYLEIRKDEVSLKKILSDSTKRAFDIALPNLNKLRKVTGMGNYPYSFTNL